MLPIPFETYNYYSVVTGTIGGTLTTQGSVFSGPAEDFQLTDIADGSIDGITPLNQTLQYGTETVPAGGIGTFVGYTNFMEPIIDTGTELRVYSGTNYAPNQPLGSSPQGPYPYCFAAGTMIATPTGPRAVERLATGDMVQTDGGGAVAALWIGRQTVHKLFSGPHMQPVRIRAGALGHDLPEADLTVTADHGMILDGLVINASALVNGTTIDFVPLDELPDRVTYYHVETEAHDVILANGAPAETFVDAVSRARFDNFAEYLALYGAERIIPEMPRPRITAPRLLPQTIRARLGIGDPKAPPFAASA